MIVETAALATIGVAVTMVDGGFDPLHAGHVGYFREAAALGDPVLCNVSADDWIAKKHPVVLPQEERCAVIDAIRWVSYVHPSHMPTAGVLRALRPARYAKGADWRGRLPEEEMRVCDELGIDVVFLDTVTNSSTSILNRYEKQSRAGRG